MIAYISRHLSISNYSQNGTDTGLQKFSIKKGTKIPTFYLHSLAN